MYSLQPQGRRRLLFSSKINIKSCTHSSTCGGVVISKHNMYNMLMSNQCQGESHVPYSVMFLFLNTLVSPTGKLHNTQTDTGESKLRREEFFYLYSESELPDQYTYLYVY